MVAPAGVFAVTRIANASVLLELGQDIVLTDPWFRSHWAFTERPGVRVADLPRLTAILGCHEVFDHWQIEALVDYPHKDTPVRVATQSMKSAAERVGFTNVAVMAWGESHALSPRLRLEAVPARSGGGRHINSYVLSTPDLRVFFGGEARDLAPLVEYRATHPAVDVCVGPCNGVRLLGTKLVMDPGDLLAGARTLGASTVIPIHGAHRSFGPLASVAGSPPDVAALAAGGLDVVTLLPGVRWLSSVSRGAPRA